MQTVATLGAALAHEALDVDDDAHDLADGDEAAVVGRRHGEREPAALDLLAASPRRSTVAPTGDGCRWSSRTFIPTVVVPVGERRRDGPAAGLLAQRDEPRRAEHVDRARPEGARRVRLAHDHLRLAPQARRHVTGGHANADGVGHGAADASAGDRRRPTR